MAREQERTSKPRLGGKEFPLHQLRKSRRFAAGGGLVSLFFIPYAISAFRDNDPDSLHARPGLVFFYAALLVWTSAWTAHVMKYRALAQSKYTRSQFIPKGGRMATAANLTRWILAWSSGLTWAVMFAAGHSDQGNPHSTKVSAGLLIASYLSGLIALALTAFLSAGSKLESEAFRLEEARGLKDEINAHEAGLKDKTDSIAQSLSERIYQRIAELEMLSGEVGNAEQARKAIQSEIDSGRQELYRAVFGLGERKNLRQQWLFAALSFCLGFVVNWLSDPALNLFHRFHF
jgi:hypothetical protein